MISLDEEVFEQKQEGKSGVPSRGIPSKFALYLPPHYSKEIRRFEENEVLTRNLWPLEDIVNFLFPKQYQPTYHEIAKAFLRYLMQHPQLSGKEISAFVKQEHISKATFYNKVLPKLKRMGLVKVERETISVESEKRKYRPMRLTLSKTFGNYLMKLADSWLAVVDEARARI